VETDLDRLGHLTREVHQPAYDRVLGGIEAVPIFQERDLDGTSHWIASSAAGTTARIAASSATIAGGIRLDRRLITVDHKCDHHRWWPIIDGVLLEKSERVREFRAQRSVI